MIYLHSRCKEEEHHIKIYTNDAVKSVILTHEKGFDLNSLWLSDFKHYILTWTDDKSLKKHLTPLSKLRNYFTYVEPTYSIHIKNFLNVHVNQYTSATEILENFNYGISSVILTAEMQSGKTGTARYVVHSLLHLTSANEEKMQSKNIYFICGMNDNDLRFQAIKEFKGLIPETNILFSKQLQKFIYTNQNLDLTAALIIIDESHYASNVNSLIDKFMNMKWVKSENPYILSISATAMAELATSHLHSKGMVYLRPDENYYSIRDIFKRGLIFQSVNITKNQADFIELIAQEYEFQTEHNDKKYNIVRIPSIWYHQDLEDDIKELGLNIDFINYRGTTRGSTRGNTPPCPLYSRGSTPPCPLYSDISDMSLECNSPFLNDTELKDFEDCDDVKGVRGSTPPEVKGVRGSTPPDFNDYIARVPERFTIIWIYGSLRAGKQLNTEHIGFVHDTAESSPDTIAQSLLGRILGYNKRNNHVKCYTDVKCAKLMCTWMTNIYDVSKIPAKSKGIKHGYSETDKKWNLHPPIGIMLDSNTRSYFRSLKQTHKNRYPYKQEFIDALIMATEGRKRAEIEFLFENYSPGRCGGLMVLTEENAVRTLTDYWDYNYNCFLKEIPVRGFDAITPGSYYYIYANLNIRSKSYGLILITRKETIIDNEYNAEYVKVKSTSRFHLKGLNL